MISEVARHALIDSRSLTPPSESLLLSPGPRRRLSRFLNKLKRRHRLLSSLRHQPNNQRRTPRRIPWIVLDRLHPPHVCWIPRYGAHLLRSKPLHPQPSSPARSAQTPCPLAHPVQFVTQYRSPTPRASGALCRAVFTAISISPSKVRAELSFPFGATCSQSSTLQMAPSAAPLSPPLERPAHIPIPLGIQHHQHITSPPDLGYRSTNLPAAATASCTISAVCRPMPARSAQFVMSTNPLTITQHPRPWHRLCLMRNLLHSTPTSVQQSELNTAPHYLPPAGLAPIVSPRHWNTATPIWHH